MHRRRYLAAVGSFVAVSAVAGCAGVLPSGTDDDTDPSHPGGTLVVENTGADAVPVDVTVVEEGDDAAPGAALDATVDAGETVVREEFVDADPGTAVTLAARLGDEGDRTTFEFLPGGGEDDAPPEVARLTVENEVEASATWTATQGS